MDVKKIIDTLKKGVDFAEQVAPLATAIGGPSIVGKVIGVVGGIIDVVENINERVKEGKAVFDATDAREIQIITGRLQKVNDALAKAIDAS